MRNIKLSIQYDGGKYRGWQRQADSELTIQGKIENVLSRMLDENIEIIGSGRTDAGVHAENQIANFKTKTKFSLKEIQEYCNNYLPEDISITEVSEMPYDFHSRYNAKEKIYQYRICIAPFQNVFLRKYSYHVKNNINISIMKEASKYFIGEHDFQSFTTLKSKKKSTKRIINSIDFKEINGMLYITYNGNGFLYNMVRIITGTLIEIGSGQMNQEEIPKIMNEKNRSFAGPTAPAQGLFLMDVKF